MPSSFAPLSLSGIHKIYTLPILLTFICLFLSACEDNSKTVELTGENTSESGQTLALPFDIKLDRSNAYLSRDYLEIYLVAESDVLLIRLKLANKNIPVLKTRISDTVSSQAIIHFQGPDVARFVLPMGAAQPLPKDAGFSRRSAVEAVINCNNLPQSGQFDYGRLITISLSNLNFGDGKQYHLKPLNLTTSAFPP